MNLNYIIGVVGALAVCLFGMITQINLGESPPVSVTPQNLLNFVDPASILITIGCTIFVVVASFPGKMLREIPKHIKIILGTKIRSHYIYRPVGGAGPDCQKERTAVLGGEGQ